MAFANVVLKKWGSSLGVVVPADVVESEKLKKGEKIRVEIKKVNDLSDFFGSRKGWKIDAQKFKDEARKNWQ